MNRSKAILAVISISAGIFICTAILWTAEKISPKPNMTYHKAVMPDGSRWACYVNGDKPLVCVPTEMEW